MPEPKPIKIRDFSSVASNRELTDFINSVDLIAVVPVIKTAIVSKNALRTPEEIEDYLFLPVSPDRGYREDLASGNPELNVSVCGARLKVFYREKP